MTGRATSQTNFKKLLSRFHFGITLFAVALSGLTILFVGVAALRGYADRNIELAAQLGAYGVEPALVFNDPSAAREGLAPLASISGIARMRVLNLQGQVLTDWTPVDTDRAPLLTRFFFPRPFVQTIQHDGASIGSIEVWGNSSTLADYVLIGLVAGVACLVGTALGIILLARRFENQLVQPINQIATVAHDVRLHRRFDKRVPPLKIVELDRLGGDINALLDELRGWQGKMEIERALLAHRASHDALTQLPNRAAFDEQLDLRIAGARKNCGRIGLLFIDVDNFKSVNDRFGHAAGDAVLVAVSRCIKEALDDHDFAARIGGDEFVVIIDPLDPYAQPSVIAERIRSCAAVPVTLPGGEVYRPSASIGVAIFPDQASDAVDMLTIADAAMYSDKLNSRIRR